jgi:DNA polymerase-3 subunit alpha
MVGIKNVGTSAVDEIVAERERGGPYKSYLDFLERIDPRAVNRKVLEMLIQTGLFDSLGEDRATLMHNLDRCIDYAAVRREARESGQGSLFGESDEVGLQLEPAESWDEMTRLGYEREYLGFYFSGHPLDQYRRRWQECTTLDTSRAVAASQQRSHRVLGLLKQVRSIPTRKGTPMAFAVLEDFNGTLELVLFSDAYARYSHLLLDETVVGVEGTVDTSRNRVQFVVEHLMPPEELPVKDSGQLHIRIGQAGASEDELYHLRAFLFERPGGCSVYIHMDEDPDHGNNGCTERVIRASDQLMVSSLPQAIEEIERHPLVAEVWKQLGD